MFEPTTTLRHEVLGAPRFGTLGGCVRTIQAALVIAHFRPWGAGQR
jgi:hypothetical protein